MAGFSQGASRSSKALLETHSFKKSVSKRTFKILTVMHQAPPCCSWARAGIVNKRLQIFLQEALL